MTTVEGAGGPAVPSPAGPAPGPVLAPEPVPAAAAPAPAPAPPQAPPAAPPDPRTQTLRAVGTGLSLLGIFLLGFAAYLYGLSSVQEARSQNVMYKVLAGQLSAAIAPTGPTVLCNPDAVTSSTSAAMCPTAQGAPVGIMNVPSIGIKDMVVVYGTSPEDLSLGPGLLRSGPLPGQDGVPEIYGRRATFGAPFAHLDQLRKGDIIRVTTGQGVSSYEVVAFGSSSRQIEDPYPNRLILLTAGSATVPTYYTYVDADLVSSPKATPGGEPAIYSDEAALSGDSGTLVDTLLWGLALAAVSVGATVAAARWKPWPTYLAAAPLVLIVLWNLYTSLAALLPNVY
jgi:sortase A